MVACCNFLGSDRSDLQYAAKEASRSMRAPRNHDLENVVRIAQYRDGKYPRLVQQVTFRK